jgi:hypothetical protein
MRRVQLVAAVVVAFLLLPVQPAVASCAQGSGPEGSPVIFVGTAESERRGYTRFAVDEVLVGPDLALEVWVLSGQEQATWPLSMLSVVGSSVDAHFVDGDRYVVGASESFRTDACSVTEADGRTSTRSAREPVENGDPGADPPIGPLVQTLWVAGVLALVAAIVASFRRWRRRPRLSGVRR